MARTTIAGKDEFSTNSQPDTTPHIDLLKQTKYAHTHCFLLNSNLVGRAMLGMSEAMFTVCLNESADIHCSTSTVGQAISAA